MFELETRIVLLYFVSPSGYHYLHRISLCLAELL